MRNIYSLILHLLIPFVLIRLLWLGRRHNEYVIRWKERFGFLNYNNKDGDVLWIHAVSVGEVQAARPIIKLILESLPTYKLIITTTTPTGATTVRQLYGNQVIHFYFPYDLPAVIKRFLYKTKPKLLIILETEIWPNLIHYCQKESIPTALINARMSEKSFRRYKLLSRFTQETLMKIDLIAAQSDEDAKRIVFLGANQDVVHITGNLKFDIVIPPSIVEKGLLLRQMFSPNRPVWIAASTHDGEEEMILRAYIEVLKKMPDCLLILAPRHPDRSKNILKLCDKHDFRTVRKSENKPCEADHNIFILDTLGELPAYYVAADLAFVGGSLVKIGGHNILEPASVGIPIIVGPYLYNFSQISKALIEIEAAWIVENIEGLSKTVINLLSDANLRHNIGNRARNFIKSNAGSATSTYTLLSKLIG